MDRLGKQSGHPGGGGADSTTRIQRLVLESTLNIRSEQQSLSSVHHVAEAPFRRLSPDEMCRLAVRLGHHRSSVVTPKFQYEFGVRQVGSSKSPPARRFVKISDGGQISSGSPRFSVIDRYFSAIATWQYVLAFPLQS